VSTVYGRIRAIFGALKLPEDIRKGLWAECANCVLAVDVLTVTKANKDPPYKRFFGKDSKLVPYLRKFGEIAILASRDKITGKEKDKGVEAMFVGYARNHSVGVYRFFVFDTKDIRESRDWRFLNMSYPQWIRKGTGEIIHWDEDERDKISKPTIDLVDDAPQLLRTDTSRNNNSDNERRVRLATDPEGTVTNEERTVIQERKRSEPSKNARLIRELSKLDSSFNPEATKTIEEAKQQEEAMEKEIKSPNKAANIAILFFGEEVEFVAESALEVPPAPPESVKSVPTTLDKLMDDLDRTLADEKMETDAKNERMRLIVGCLKEYKPKTFQSTWHHKNMKFRERFWQAIRKEFREMLKRGIWRNMKRRDIPAGRRTI
jgi:hypothetical protein